MYWVNFLHIYQPPNQKPYWIKKIAAESYRKLTKGFLANPSAKATININAVLTELFEKNVCQDIINDLKTLALRGQIEFTSSGKYHPFFPLLPKEEIIRQIKLNDETNKKYFGEIYQPKGFFPPEMEYNLKVAQIAKKLGFKWIIIDELGFSPETGQMDHQTIYDIEGLTDLNVFFREREMSFRILSAEVFSPKMITDLFAKKFTPNDYVITAMDGETFGHHRPGLEEVLFEVYKEPSIQSVQLSDLSSRFSKHEKILPRDSSWALMMKDIERNIPFSRWFDPENPIQVMQWDLANLAIKTVKRLTREDSAWPQVRDALDRAIHSDQFWWASAKPWWSLEMIERGAKELKDVIEHCPASKKGEIKRAKEWYAQILFTGFEWQRSGKVEEISRSNDEDVIARITAEMPYIPEAEFNGIVSNLQHQMESSSKNLEFERAAQLRDRIKELEGKRNEITRQQTI